MISKMAPEVDPAQESVVLASFQNRHAAEHMLSSLGRGFRKEARKGQVTALLVSANKDGSLQLTQSRVLTAGGVGAALIRVPFAWTLGFMGLLSTLKGATGFGTPSTYTKLTSDRMSKPPMRSSPALERTQRSRW